MEIKKATCMIFLWVDLSYIVGVGGQRHTHIGVA